MLTYNEAKNKILSLYDESAIDDSEYIYAMVDLSTKYESGLDDFSEYMEGFYQGLHKTIDKTENKIISGARKSSAKAKEREAKKHAEGKTTFNDKLMQGNAALNKGFKKVGVAATHIYSKFKKDMMTAKEKEKMANKVAAGTKLATLALTEPIPLGPIQVALNTCAFKVAMNPKDDVDKELNKLIMKAKDTYNRFKGFIAKKAEYEKDREKFKQASKGYEKETGKIALAIDNRTRYLSTKSVSESVNDVDIDFISTYVLEDGHVTDSGLLILEHIMEKGYYNIVDEILMKDLFNE
jgi:hypothetical protein